MACSNSADNTIRQSGMRASDSPSTSARFQLVEALFRQLPGSWVLSRRLQSTNVSEPAGSCTGTATFTPREPSVFTNDDGKLELAAAEMVYHEQGYFHMQQVSAGNEAARFPFSRKYVWRLKKKDNSLTSDISIWFTKPGTEVIDYLFHNININGEDTIHGSTSTISLNGEGGHLCEEDFYSSAYTFEFDTNHQDEDGDSATEIQLTKLKTWTTLHEVRGPKKDQVIETFFSAK